MVSVNIPDFRRRGLSSSAVGFAKSDTTQSDNLRKGGQQILQVSGAEQNAEVAKGGVASALMGVVASAAEMKGQRQVILEKNKASTAASEFSSEMDSIANGILSQYQGDKEGAIGALDEAYKIGRANRQGSFGGDFGEEHFNYYSDRDQVKMKTNFNRALDAKDNQIAIANVQNTMAMFQNDLMGANSDVDFSVIASKMHDYASENIMVLGKNYVNELTQRLAIGAKGYMANLESEDPLAAARSLEKMKSYLMPDDAAAIKKRLPGAVEDWHNLQQVGAYMIEMAKDKDMLTLYNKGDDKGMRTKKIQDISDKTEQLKVLYELPPNSQNKEQINRIKTSKLILENELEAITSMMQLKADPNVHIALTAKLNKFMTSEENLKYYKDGKFQKKLVKVMSYEDGLASLKAVNEIKLEASEALKHGLITYKNYAELTSKAANLGIIQKAAMEGIRKNNPGGADYGLFNVATRRATEIGIAVNTSEANILKRLESIGDVAVQNQLTSYMLSDFSERVAKAKEEKGSDLTPNDILRLEAQSYRVIVAINNPKYDSSLNAVDAKGNFIYGSDD